MWGFQLTNNLNHAQVNPKYKKHVGVTSGGQRFAIDPQSEAIAQANPKYKNESPELETQTNQ